MSKGIAEHFKTRGRKKGKKAQEIREKEALVE